MNLSEKEKSIIYNKDFLTLKISAINKIIQLFEETRATIKKTIDQTDFNFAKEIDVTYGKVFKGENYKSLPYVVLDFPKFFSKDSTFAYRTMFWWGNFFSVTLHLEGKYFDFYSERIIANLKNKTNEEIFFCIGNDPWQYYYGKDNYLKLSDENYHLLQEVKFLKLSKKIDLDNYKNIPTLANEYFIKCLDLMKSEK